MTYHTVSTLYTYIKIAITDTQYLYNNTKKLKNLQDGDIITFMTMYHSFSSASWRTAPLVVRESTTNFWTRTFARCPSSSSDGLVQKLPDSFSWWFSHKTAAVYTDQWPPHHFFTTFKSHTVVKPFSEGLWLQLWPISSLASMHTCMGGASKRSA